MPYKTMAIIRRRKLKDQSVLLYTYDVWVRRSIGTDHVLYRISLWSSFASGFRLFSQPLTQVIADFIPIHLLIIVKGKWVDDLRPCACASELNLFNHTQTCVMFMSYFLLTFPSQFESLTHPHGSFFQFVSSAVWSAISSLLLSSVFCKDLRFLSNLSATIGGCFASPQSRISRLSFIKHHILAKKLS